MYGVVTRNTADGDDPTFDRVFYEVKDVTGRTTNPLPTTVNMVSCFGDSTTADADPSLVPVSRSGEKATRDQRYFDWGYICPSRPAYRDQVLDTIEACAAVNPSVRLDDIGFPRPEYCHCSTCNKQYAESDHDEWSTWRASVITDFVQTAVARIPGRTYLTLYPDPYPNHLFRRAGLDIRTLTPLIDEFVIPLYDMAYTTTYWIEVIATGFSDLLDHPFSIELYAVNIEHENLVRAGTVAAAYADHVVFAYDSDAARRAIDTLRDQTQPGSATP